MTANHPCPHCGQLFQLDENYLAQFGGRETTCSACGKPMTLPTLDILRTAPLPPIAAAAPTLGYAGPAGAMTNQVQVNSIVWEEGALIVPSGTELPHACVKCNQPGAVRIKRKLYWHAPEVYVALLAGIFIYFIVALVMRKNGVVTFSLCQAHSNKRRNGIIAGSVIAALGLGLIVHYAMNSPVDALFGGQVPFGILGFIVGLIMLFLSIRAISANRIDKGYIWLAGTGKAFRLMFPHAEQRRQMLAQQHAARYGYAAPMSYGPR
jgi:hypothetical protein